MNGTSKAGKVKPSVEADRESWPTLTRFDGDKMEWILRAPAGYRLKALHYDGHSFVCVTEASE